MKKQVYINLILLGFLCAIVISSCKKTATFSTDKQNYVIGETVTATNKSEIAPVFIWTSNAFGGEIKTKDLRFVANNVGKFNITLASCSKKNKVYDEVTQTINVRGYFVFYSTIYYEPVELSIDGKYVGKLTQPYPYPGPEPDCGAPGCVTIALEDGEHEITVSLPYDSYSYTEYISGATACTKIQLR